VLLDDLREVNMRKFAAVCWALTGFFLICWSVSAEAADNPDVVLRVTGDVETPLSLTKADLDSFPRHEVTTTIHEQSVRFSGIALRDVVGKAGPPSGIEVSQAIVIARASDGYFAVFALVELEKDFTDKLIIAADRKDGVLLSDKEGPLRSVVQGEKLGSRSIRQLVELEVRLIEDE
jgi:DMSO/TMAO reductase YedYZ molybdopterin-dependent catalytic subunit